MHLEPLIPEEQIKARVKQLAEEIRDAYPQERPLLVAVLKGAVVFLADLMRELGSGYAVDFMAIRTYEGKCSSGAVEIRLDLGEDIQGRDVLLVEDIVDTGATLNYLWNLLKARNPRSLRVATLLLKPSSYQATVPIDFVGFSIPDVFVVGYGLDLDEEWRNLPYLAVVKEESPSTENMV